MSGAVSSPKSRELSSSTCDAGVPPKWLQQSTQCYGSECDFPPTPGCLWALHVPRWAVVTQNAIHVGALPMHKPILCLPNGKGGPIIPSSDIFVWLISIHACGNVTNPSMTFRIFSATHLRSSCQFRTTRNSISQVFLCVADVGVRSDHFLYIEKGLSVQTQCVHLCALDPL